MSIKTGDMVIDNSISKMNKICTLRLKITIALKVKAAELSVGRKEVADLIQAKIDEYEREIRYWAK